MTSGSGGNTVARKLLLRPLKGTDLLLKSRFQIMMDIFNMFDVDGSGEIELNELAKAFKTTGKLTEETRAELQAHFDFMDSDGSGEVTIDEFRAALGQGRIAFRNYQHQRVYQALGLALCQSLVVYRRLKLYQEFERMKQQSSEKAECDFQGQFDCLVQALIMSTFALDLKRSPVRQSDGNDGGSGGGSGGKGGDEKKGSRKKKGPQSERGRRDTLIARDQHADDQRLLQREALVLARILAKKHPRRQLRPLSPSRRQHIRAKIVEDVAVARSTSAKMSTHDKSWMSMPHRNLSQKPVQRMPRKLRSLQPFRQTAGHQFYLSTGKVGLAALGVRQRHPGLNHFIATKPSVMSPNDGGRMRNLVKAERQTK